jgi:hypothetical protein
MKCIFDGFIMHNPDQFPEQAADCSALQQVYAGFNKAVLQLKEYVERQMPHGTISRLFPPYWELPAIFRQAASCSNHAALARL